MNERYLIINADDFGICDSADRAILRLLQEKRITSTSLMAPAPLAAEAVRLAAERSLPAGVHWTLNSDWDFAPWQPVAPAEAVPSLQDGKGLCHDTRLLAHQARSAEVTAELEAQVKWMVENGCAPDHADSHCGTLYGINGRPFFINAFRVCRKYGLPFRLPKGPSFLADQFRREAPRPVRSLQTFIVGLAAVMGVDLLDNLITNPYSIREISGYDQLSEYYLRRVASLPAGITEMFLHPSYPDPAISAHTKEWSKREMELRFLLSDDLFRLIEKEGIRLVSWGEAPFPHRRGKASERNAPDHSTS